MSTAGLQSVSRNIGLLGEVGDFATRGLVVADLWALTGMVTLSTELAAREEVLLPDVEFQAPVTAVHVDLEVEFDYN